MILFDPEKASHLMKQWDVHVLLPHTLLNARLPGRPLEARSVHQHQAVDDV